MTYITGVKNTINPIFFGVLFSYIFKTYQELEKMSEKSFGSLKESKIHKESI